MYFLKTATILLLTDSVGQKFEQNPAEMACVCPRYVENWSKISEGLGWIDGWDFLTNVPCTWAWLTGHCHLKHLFVVPYVIWASQLQGSQTSYLLTQGSKCKCSKEQGRSCIAFITQPQMPHSTMSAILYWSVCHRPASVEGEYHLMGSDSIPLRKCGMGVTIVAIFRK